MPIPPPPSAPGASSNTEQIVLPAGEVDDVEDGVLQIVPISPSTWETIPPNCLRRMFEFTSVRTEYLRSFENPPDQNRLDSSQRLALEDLLELAQRNSREYQTQKESLYRAALALSLERYAYQLKFTPTGNGIDVDWQHLRSGGMTENTLGLPLSASIDKVLATGGNFLARFATNVVLTFNGPTGFAADVGSEIFADFTQSLLQRDTVFENLTQAERNVVYAARDYARFRKLFFRDIASDYYSLLLTYRGIEIDALDFFSNRRGFDQAQAEYRAGDLPRFQVDQFEQNALASRSSLIGSCNSLEQGLDALKLRLGVPPETPVNLDLQELEQLTAQDKATVALELVRRSRRILVTESQEPVPNPTAVINSANNLASRMLELVVLQEALGQESIDRQAVQQLSNLLRVEEALLVVDEERRSVRTAVEADRPRPLNIFQRRMDLIRALLTLGRRQLVAAGTSPQDDDQLSAFARDFEQLRQELENLELALPADPQSQSLDELRQQLGTLERELGRILQLVRESDTLVNRIDTWVSSRAALLRRPTTDVLAEESLHRSLRLLSSSSSGLAAIEMTFDDAMITALVTRLDLMNQRGELGDVWRQVKLAGDDLRSVLNLGASQAVRTRSDVNRPFDFTFDESETRLDLTFDAPLNRRAQRNAYRTSLINYQQALRNLTEFQDQIKVAVRNDLRNLQLDREQYHIAIASAALANERVFSTRLQLRRGLGNVTARDFLEAQAAYTASLSRVASERIGYIVDRINLFLDLELLEVDDLGFWPQLYDESHQPSLRLQPPHCSGPAYGPLPRGVLYSDSIRRLDRVPFGSPVILNRPPPTDP